ncbi:hypothetical protein GCM10007082_23140 [Oceanisphaera arctica]|nr:hypothetical protein GCM10007082_23140 [Oceanisphaera arctica]
MRPNNTNLNKNMIYFKTGHERKQSHLPRHAMNPSVGARKCRLTAREGGNAGTAGAFFGPGISRSWEALSVTSP